MGRPLLRHLARVIILPIAWLSERFGSRFYVVLGVLVAAVSTYGIVGGFTGGMKHQAYDLIMKSRFRAPPADPDIVLVDIDEASLAAMAGEFGRWPWARSVMAELTEGVARQHPAAIVYDITFSDLDVDHPDADRYFRDVIKRHPNTYFAMIRLNSINDKLSELKLAQLPGAARHDAEAMPDATVAMVVPYFLNVLDDRRLGTNNLYADDDGVARSYHVHRDNYGWRIYSLPASVVAALRGELPERSDVLLNWRGARLSYRVVPFYAVYQSFERQKSDRPPDEFTGKIVVIGSTAPSLFDIKPTPIARDHPGVDIMMTAIDNLKNSDYLTELPRGFYALITLVALALLTIAFIYNVDTVWLTTLFTAMQTGFLAVSYLFLNFTTWFVDLTAPFTAALAYFFVARLYLRVLVGRRNGDALYSIALDPGRDCQALLFACRFRAGERAQRRANRILQREVGRTRYGASASKIFNAPLVSGLYRDTVLFYWLVAPSDTCAALRDLFGMLERGYAGLRRQTLESSVQLGLHAVRFAVDAEGNWRAAGKRAFVQALDLVQQPMRGTLARTDAFGDVCDECASVPIPASLARAGLHSDQASAPG